MGARRRRAGLEQACALFLCLFSGCPSGVPEGVTSNAPTPPDDRPARARALLASLEAALHAYCVDESAYPGHGGIDGRKAPPTAAQDHEFVRALLAPMPEGGGMNAPYIEDLQLGRLGADGKPIPVVGPVDFSAAERPVILDPWGHPLHYREWQSRATEIQGPAHQPNAFDLWSDGPDGSSGTADDITNW